MNQETMSEDVKVMQKVLHRMEKYNRGFKTILIVWLILPLVLVGGLFVMYGLEGDVEKWCASANVEKLTVEQVNATMEAKAQLTVLLIRIQRDAVLVSGVLGFCLGFPLVHWYRRQSNQVMICLVRAHLANLEAATNGKAILDKRKNLEDAADIAAADAAMAEPGKAIPYDKARKDLGIE